MSSEPIEMKITNLRNAVTSVLRTGTEAQAAEHAEEAADSVSDETARSKAAQFTQMLENRGGRMKQVTIVSETEWSAATVSRVLSEMEADGRVHKIAVGRENVITLAGSEPEWYQPPDATAAPPSGDTNGRSAADGDRAILLVEDDPQAVRLLKEAFDEAGISNPVYVVRDGLDAVDFLLQRGSYRDAPRPALVLLDLTLKVVDGSEVLAELDEQDALRRTPMLVLSQSSNPEDVRSAYDRGAAAYLTKPDEFEGLVTLASAIESFWLTHVVPAPSQRTIA